MFLLRAPSECLTLVRRLPREKMGADSALERPSVFGLGKGNLVIKLRRRAHIAAGSRMIRKCLREKCPDGSPHMICPTCGLLGERCSPELTAKAPRMDCGARPEGAAGKRPRNWEEAEKRPHSIRRGAARAILVAEGSFAQLLRAGQWRPSAYRLYLGVGIEEKKTMASVLLGASGDDGSERGARRGGEDIPIAP